MCTFELTEGKRRINLKATLILKFNKIDMNGDFVVVKDSHF